MLNAIIFSFLFIAGLLFPSIAIAGPLEGLTGVAQGVVDDVTTVIRIGLGGYFAFCCFQLYSGSPNAGRSLGYCLVGGVLFFTAPAIIASLGGA